MLLAPLWLPFWILRIRGHALDGVLRARETLVCESWLNARAQQAGLVRVNPFEAFPGLALQKGFLSAEHWGSSHDRVEYPLLTALCAHLRPRQIFEFGTFHGEATLLFARSCPEARITTLNIPGRQNPRFAFDSRQRSELLAEEAIGSAFRETPEAMRIEQLLLDSADLDPSHYRGR